QTFTFDKLVDTAHWNGEVEIDKDGTATFNFTKQYGAYSFEIPESVDVSKLDRIEFDVVSGEDKMSVKFFGDKEMQDELAVTYGGSVLSTEKCEKTPVCFGIMSLGEEEYQIVAKSVTFVMKKSGETEKTEVKRFVKPASDNNPIVTQRYSADPGVMVYNDTVYIYATNDVYEYDKDGNLAENTYSKINTLNCFSSTDMVNWTDHGVIAAAGKDGAAKWAKNSWAPAAAHKTINGKEKFFLYFADNAGGIGVLTSDSPTGPWSDPLGHALISRSTPTCDTVEWLFDPAVLVDDDGTGYLYFGGGVPKGKEADPGTARVVKLGDDMISLAGDPVRINPPYLFEDSGINKIGDKYYYSYCSNWNTSGSGYNTAAIEYMTSDSPMGPFTYEGELFQNPGVFWNVWGNNHHSMFEFKDKYYLAYHARAIETGAIGKSLGYRSTQIDEVTINDGKIVSMTPSMTGVAQLATVNPYERVEAECIGRESGIDVEGCGDTYVKASAGDWSAVKGVDFKYGVSDITLAVRAQNASSIEIHTGNPQGTLVGTVEINNTDGEFKEFTVDTVNVSGEKNLYFVYTGDVEFDYWKANTANVFTFDKLTEVMKYDVASEITSDGKIKLDFDKKWAEIRFAVPESVDVKKLEALVLNVSKGDSSKLAVKLLKEYDPVEELTVNYENDFVSADISNKEDIKYFGIMAMDDNVSFEIDSVEFKMEADAADEDEEPAAGVEYDVPDLKDAITARFDSDFIVGGEITGADINDKNLMALMTKHFNALTLGNELKPDCTFGYSNSKCPGKETVTLNGEEIEVPTTDFSRAEKALDVILKWNNEHPEDFIKVRGHVLVWHSQTPEWFFHEDYDADKPYVDKATMTKRQEWYIKTVLEHFMGEDSPYKNLFYGWDVVNEAVSDGTGTYRSDKENSSWWAVYQSNEFIINAFRFANKYAPADVELYYNDYNECVPLKSEGIAQLLKDVKAAEGTRIDGMGMQGHYMTEGSPSIEDFKNAARKYGSIVDKVHITELDLKASNAFDGTDATKDAEYTKQAYRYREIYDAIAELREEGINYSNITIWGNIDKNSWLQDSNSVGGASDGKQKQCPVLFDDYYHVKPAYWAFVDSNKLQPEIKSIDIIQSVNDGFVTGNKVEFGDSNTKVTAIPVWNENGIKVKAIIEDASEDANDIFTVYLSVNGEIKKVSVNRKDAKAVENGYEAVVDIPFENAEFKPATEILIDFVAVNGSNKVVFNDYTYSQDEKSEYYAKAVLKPYAFIPKGTVTVDGVRDDAWKDAANIPLLINLGSKVSANASLLWDEEYLYAYVNVTDSVLNSDSANAHEKDSFELFIDENNNKTNSYEDDDKQYRINYLNEHSFNGKKCLEENITSFANVTDNGYEIELAIKWTDITPEVGNNIGLELQINDADATGSRIGTLSWYDVSGQGWSKPGVFGTVTLADKAGEAPVPEESEVDPSDIPEDGVIPEGLWIAKVKDATYTSKAVEPEVHVYIGKKRLVLNEDYTVKYSNNTAVAKADAKKAPTVLITYKGEYTGKEEVHFTINPADINSEAFEINDVVVAYNKKVQKPSPKVLLNGKELKKNTDYTITYPSTGADAYKEAGKYDIKITGKNNFTGEKTVKVIITKATLISKATVSKIADQICTGEAIKPELVIKYGKKTLVEGKDYKIEYKDNVEVGKATVKITGINDYAGTKTVSFNIVATALKASNVSNITEKFVYEGIAVEPELKVTVKNADNSEKVLEKDVDYTVSYSNNTKAGTATAVVKGIGKYTGTVKKTFKIIAFNLSTKENESKLGGNIKDTLVAKFDKKGSKPEIIITVNGNTLVNGKDYTVSYSNNKAVNTADAKKKAPTFTITGKNGFKGKITKTFTIQAKSFSDNEAPVCASAKDVVIKDKANNFANKKIVLKDANGIKLTAGTDYDKNIEYSVNGKVLAKTDKVNAGDVVTATITGKGNYTGTMTVSYKAVRALLGSASVKSLASKQYTGSAITLSENDFVYKDKKGVEKSRVTVSGKELKYGVDFEIDETSYVNNIKKGTAKVKIIGIGEYSGSKTVSFKIVTKK
ncbi:MAG: endo-1,4-beta-xylanase, partial [Lachnospiraceae bacterium]|nr:endo-1,4-beta-xylanase [Lachnospiraceae bacterium]